MRAVAAITDSRNKWESEWNTCVTGRSSGLAGAAYGAVGHVGAGVEGGAITAPGVLALVRTDTVADNSVHTKINLPVILLTVLTEVDVPTECPVVLYETQIGSLVFLETGTSLRTRIDNINEENAILDDLVFNVLRNCSSGEVEFDLYPTARGNEVGREVGGREEKKDRA